MQLRTMTEADIPAGMRLKDLAGWNQTAADWIRFLRASPQGCFVAELEGQVRGTSATISFEGRFAWVGMVLVDPEYRSRGVGTALLERAIQYLDDLGVPTIKLDATPQGKPLYEKMGFVSEYRLARWTLRRPAAQAAGPEPLPAELLAPIFAADRDAFGADRGSLLRSLAGDAPEFAAGIRNHGALDGYAFGRRGSFADQVGPLMARSAGAARELLVRFLGSSGREQLIMDSPESNSAARDLLESFGFTYSRLLTRMYRGPNTHPGRPEMLWAIMGPEFG